MGVDQIAKILGGGSGEPIYIDGDYIYADGTVPGDSSSYSGVNGSEIVNSKTAGSWTVITPEDGNRHGPDPFTAQTDYLTATPNDYGATATHVWHLPDPNYGTAGESGDEVDTIELDYDTADFGNVENSKITVELTRTLSDGRTRDVIGLNSGTYSGSSITIDLSGFSQSDVAGSITVTIEDVINPKGVENPTLTLTGDAASNLTKEGLFPEENPRALPPDKLNIHHIDIGVGDTSIIRTPQNETILVDTSEDASVPLFALNKLDIVYIDYLVSTHAHTDHVGGSEAIINEFVNNRDGIGAIIDNGVSTGSQTYQDYIQAAMDNNVPILDPNEGDSLGLDGANSLILNPKTGSLNSIQHDNSVFLKVESLDKNLVWLVTGDGNATAEQRVVDNWASELPSDVLQVGHHGSDTSSTDVFLDEVQPTIGVFSAPISSSFDHPKDSILDKYSNRGITGYWTALHGNIVTEMTDPITTDTDSTASTDPADWKSQKQ